MYVRFFYLCKVKSVKKRYAKWHNVDWSYQFSDFQKLGAVVHYNTFIDVKPVELEKIEVVDSTDFLSEPRVIYHKSWFILPRAAFEPFLFDVPEDFDYFAFAVSTLSDLGYLDLVMDMLRQQKEAGFSPEAVPASPSFRL